MVDDEIRTPDEVVFEKNATEPLSNKREPLILMF